MTSLTINENTTQILKDTSESELLVSLESLTINENTTQTLKSPSQRLVRNSSSQRLVRNSSSNNPIWIDEKPYEWDNEKNGIFVILFEKHYKPAAFQKHACDGLNKGNHVLALAHTGSGKTYVLEHAIALGIKQNVKIICTFPIKVLTNQKFRDLSEDYDGMVGIETGDNKINLDAQIILMTTECLKNKIMINPNYLQDVGFVVFDEFHYINDSHRGQVWEKCITNIPKHIQMVFLSATFDNPHEFVNWVGPLKERAVTIVRTKERPVPLNHYIFDNNCLQKIMDNSGKYDSEKISPIIDGWIKNKNYGRQNLSKINDFANWLSENSKVPALWFLLSRNRCEEYANKITDSFIDHEVRSKIEKLFDKLLAEEHKENGVDYRLYDSVLNLKKTVMKGIAYHHAGLLRICREIVELLFVEGYIKILFATETFAIGVNAPAKATIFSELTKPDERYGFRMLSTAEYLQMAGRAGRKGIDEYGECILYPIYNKFSNNEVKTMMTNGKLNISSKLQINTKTILEVIYSTSLNPKISLIEYFNNSLLGNEEFKISESLKKQKEDKENELKELNDRVLNSKEKEVEEQIIDLESRRKPKWKKKNQRKRFEEEEKVLQGKPEYKTLMNLSNKRSKLEEDIYRLESRIKNSLFDKDIYNIIRFLSNSSYFNSNFDFSKDLNEIKMEDLSERGIIASQINYVNEIFFTEFILSLANEYNDLEPEELVSLISIFINDREEDIIISDLKIPKRCKSVIKKVIQPTNKLLHETHIGWNIPYNCSLNYSFMEASYNWAINMDEKELFDSLNLHMGTFVSNMLRIINILDEMESICSMNEFFDLEKLCIKGKKEIHRGIVNFDSLYLS